MKISEIMTDSVLSVRTDETADVAARLLSGHNIGALPVTDGDEQLVGMVTDRDLVVRCMAAGLDPAAVTVSQIMSAGALTADPEENTASLSARMGQAQVRRAPVVKDGRLTGIVSLSDLARADRAEAMTALGLVSDNISRR